MRFFGIALLASAASLAMAAPSRDAGVARVQAAMERLPLRFEANLGQWNSAVRYAAHAQRFSLLFTAEGPSLVFGRGRRVDLALDNSNRAPESRRWPAPRPDELLRRFPGALAHRTFPFTRAFGMAASIPASTSSTTATRVAWSMISCLSRGPTPT